MQFLSEFLDGDRHFANDLNRDRRDSNQERSEHMAISYELDSLYYAFRDGTERSYLCTLQNL